MAVRPLRPSDHATVITAIDDWWGGRQMADMLPRLFFEHFTDTCFAAERDGELAGFLVGFLSQSRPAEAYIHFVGVHPDYRRQQLARQLYEKFFECVCTRGRRCVRCITSPVNKTSIAFHKAMGFQIEPGDTQVDGISAIVDYESAGQPRVTFCRAL